MALVFEERKTEGGNILNLAIWMVLVIILAAGSYYVFFKNPDLIPVAPPPGFAETKAVSELTLDPQAVIQDLESRGFQVRVTVPSASTGGRSNPFLSNF